MLTGYNKATRMKDRSDLNYHTTDMKGEHNMKKTTVIIILLTLVMLFAGCDKLTEIEKIDIDAAKAIALTSLGLDGSELSYAEAVLKDRDGRAYYDVSVVVDGVSYGFAIDATSGVIIERSGDGIGAPPDANGYIGEAQAFALAHTDAGYTAEQSTLIFWELKENNGEAKYSIWFEGVGQGYHYFVDAVTGEILSREKTAIEIPGRNNDDIDPEMNVYPLNPAGEEPAMEVIQPPIGSDTVIDLTPAEVEYPITDYLKTERAPGITSTEILKAITEHSGYSRLEIRVLAYLAESIGAEYAHHVYFTTPDGKYFYYAVGHATQTVLRWESADALSELSHPLRDSATKVVMPEGMISIEEAYGYALRVNLVYNFNTETLQKVWKDDVILYVAEADYRNGEYEYDFIYQDKESGWFATVTVRASDGAVRNFGCGRWRKGYFGGFETVTAVKVTEAEAKTMALSYVPGAAETDITAFVTDTAEGKMEYEGTITYRGMRYTFEIDAYSGAFRSWNAAPVK